MIFILNHYEQDGMNVTEYTKDGETISHTVKTPIPQEIEPIEPQEPEPTNREIQETQMAIMSGIFDIYMAQMGL